MPAKFNKKGFTLIELLIVIAVLGLLAVVVLIALNPVQQLARTRDSGRRSGVTQMGHAIEAYGTSHNGVYIPESGCQSDWLTCLQTSGELSVVATLIDYTAGTAVDPDAVECTAGGSTYLAKNGYCYDASAADGTGPAIIYARLESQSEDSKCTDATGTIAAWAVWDTFKGRGGTVCSAAEPTVNAAGQTFVD